MRIGGEFEQRREIDGEFERKRRIDAEFEQKRRIDGELMKNSSGRDGGQKKNYLNERNSSFNPNFVC